VILKGQETGLINYSLTEEYGFECKKKKCCKKYKKHKKPCKKCPKF
tara:strand:- start:73 stop:210 length:138 start_codon:yes stop_codon:yes gene_type:complete